MRRFGRLLAASRTMCLAGLRNGTALAERERGNGIVYDSIRRPGGTSVCIFRPTLVNLPVTQAGHYEYRWNAAADVTVPRLTSVDLG